MISKKYFAAGLACLLSASLILSIEVFAQEEVETVAVEQSAEVKIDTEVTPEDLGVGKPKVLPGSFFYGFKNFIRGMQEAVALDPLKKAEVQLRHTNEKMIEAQQLVEVDKTDKAAEIAAGVIKGINRSFEKISNQSEKLKNAKTKNAQGVNNFLDKIADQSLKQQVVMQRLQAQVPEKVFANIEESRQAHLERFDQVMNKVSGNSGELARRLPQIIENREGSDFKELKAVEILRDLEDKVPEEAREALRQAQSALSQRFEQRFSTIAPEVRKEKLQSYVESLPGNAVRQFEAFDRMKESFQSEGMAKEMELAKDKAIQKFENQFSQFQGQEARQVFMQPWQSGSPETLRTMTEIEMRMEPAEREESLKPVFQDFQQFRQEAQNNFKERFNQNPEQLRQSPIFQRMENRPDIVDLKMSQDLVKIFSPSEREPIQGMPKEGTPSALNFMRDFRNQATEKFIENFSNQPVGQEAMFGPPVPGGLKVLEEMKNQVPFQGQQGINRAIEAQTQTIERHMERVDDPLMFEKYKQQIEGDKTIKQQIQQFGPPTFFRRIEERSQQMEKMEQKPINQPIFKPSDGENQQKIQLETREVNPRPVVPLTPERVELFKDRIIEQNQIEQKPVEFPTPERVEVFEKPIIQERIEPAPIFEAPAPQPTSQDTFERF